MKTTLTHFRKQPKLTIATLCVGLALGGTTFAITGPHNYCSLKTTTQIPTGNNMIAIAPSYAVTGGNAATSLMFTSENPVIGEQTNANKTLGVGDTYTGTNTAAGTWGWGQNDSLCPKVANGSDPFGMHWTFTAVSGESIASCWTVDNNTSATPNDTHSMDGTGGSSFCSVSDSSMSGGSAFVKDTNGAVTKYATARGEDYEDIQ